MRMPLLLWVGLIWIGADALFAWLWYRFMKPIRDAEDAREE